MKTVVAHIWYKTNESNTEKFKLNDGKVSKEHTDIFKLWFFDLQFTCC